MGTLRNPTFETPGGLPAEVVAGADEFYALTEGMGLRAFVNDLPVQIVTVVQGTFAVVVGTEGPYNLADLDTLDVTVDGVLFPVVLSDADFEDITAALASELVSVLADAIGPAVALSSTGDALGIGSPTQGEAGSIQIGGTAAPKIGLSEELVTGITYFEDMSNATALEVEQFLAEFLDTTTLIVDDGGGRPRFRTVAQGSSASLRFEGILATVLGLPIETTTGFSVAGSVAEWEILSNSTIVRWADFEQAGDLPSLPYEGFNVGWAGIAGFDVPGPLGADDLADGGLETFDEGWPVVLMALGPKAAGLSEPFTDWVVAGFTEIDPVGVFDTPLAVETFDDWGDFVDEIVGGVELEFDIPGDISTTETFGDDGNATPAQYIGDWASTQPPAGTYLLNVGGHTYSTVADGVLFASDLSADLATQINAAADGVEALEVSSTLMLWRPDRADFMCIPEAADGAPNNEFTILPAVQSPTIAGFWTAILEV